MAASCEKETSELTQTNQSLKSESGDDDVSRDRDDETKTQSTIGHKLLLKQGWQAGLGLGKDLQGPLDAVDIAVSNDELSGFGDKKMEVPPAEKTEDGCDAEENANHLLQEQALEREKAIEGSLAELKSSFYCELCDKQYNKHSEFDNHVNSYDHAHTQRLKELRQKDSVMKLGGSRLHDEKKLEKELKRISEFADAHAERSPVGSNCSEGQEDGEDEGHLYATELQSLEDLDVDSENFSGLSQEQKVFLNELKAALELRQKDPDIDMDSIPLPPPPTTVFFHDDCHAPPLPGDIELDSIPMPVPRLDAIPMPDTLAPIPDSLPAGPAPLPGSCATAQAFLSRILGGGNSPEDDAETGKVETVPEGDEAKKKHPTIIVQNRGGVVSFSLSKKNQAVGGPSVFETAAARMKPIKLKRKKPKQDDSIQSKIAEMEEEKRREEEERKLRGDGEVNEFEEADTYGDSPRTRTQRFKFVAFTKSENDKNPEDKLLDNQAAVDKEKMLGFIKVQNSAGDKELDWPSEMIQSTKCTPSICYSCNPLQFDYATLFPGMKKLHDKKSRPKRHKKKRKKSKTKKTEDSKEGTEDKNAASHEGDHKKKHKKKKHKKSEKEKSTSKEDAQTTSEPKISVKEEVKEGFERKIEAMETVKADDSGTEGGDEQKTDSQKKAKKKFHRKKKLSESKSGAAAPEETKVKEKSHRKPREESKKGSETGEVSTPAKKRKNRSKSSGHEDRTTRPKSGKNQSNDGKKKMRSDNVPTAIPVAAQTMEEEGGRVSDFETKEGVTKLNADADHAGKSKWDTSSDSEMENMMQMKEKLKASVKKEATKKTKTAPPAAIAKTVPQTKEVSNSQGVKTEEKNSHRSRKDSEKSLDSKRKRKRSERDHSSDYSSSGDRRYRSGYSDTDRSRSRSRSYSTGSYTDSYYSYTSDSDYSYGSYSRSRSRSPYYSYSSYSDDDYYRSRRSRSYSRHRSRSYSRSRQRKRSFSRSYSRSYTRSRSRTRSRSYGRSRRSYDKDSSRHRREMKSSPDKQFSSVLPKKGPTRKKAETHQTKEPKHFDKEKLVAPVPKINTKEEVTQQAQELLQKVKDKKDDPESSTSSSKIGPSPQIPSSSEKGPVLPLIGKAPAGARRRNPLEGDRKEEDMDTSVASIPTPEESAKSIPLPDNEQPAPSSTPGDESTSTTTVTTSDGKSFIGPKLPTDHPLAHKQDIPSPKDIPVQCRFQAIGPNDPLVFKKKSAGGPPVVIPPDQEDMYRKLQEQAQKHAEQRRREEAGILSSDSDDEEKATSEQGSEAELLQQQQLQDEIDAETILIPRELTPGEIPIQTAMIQPTVIALPRPGILTAAPQLAVAQPRAISLGGQLIAGHPAGMIPQPTMLIPQTGTPMYASSAHPQAMFSQPHLQTVIGAPSPLIHPTLQPTLQPIGLRAFPAAFPQQPTGFVHAIPGAGVAVQQPTLVRHILPQGILRPANPF